MPVTFNEKYTAREEIEKVNSNKAYSVIAENLPEFTDLHDEASEHAERENSIGFPPGKTYPNAAAGQSFSPVPSLWRDMTRSCWDQFLHFRSLQRETASCSLTGSTRLTWAGRQALRTALKLDPW